MDLNLRGKVLKVRELDIPGVVMLVPTRHDDDRGFFSEVFNERELRHAGIEHDWVQDNHVLSRLAGTLRGLHFQIPPHAQTKLIRVSRGAIHDVVVDLRAGSPAFGKWLGVQLDASTWNQLLVPAGCAHGYLTLEPDTEVLYKVDAHYSLDASAGLVWNDADLAIEWPSEPAQVIISPRDANLPGLKNVNTPFKYKG